jgi:hypothetical protein
MAVIIIAIAVAVPLGICQVNIGIKAVQAALPTNQLRIYQLRSMYVGEWVRLCATSTSADVDISELAWTHHRQSSSLKWLKGMPRNCRRYATPSNPGWDRVKVVFESLTRGYTAATTFTILPQPPRP